MRIDMQPHPAARVAAFTTRFEVPLGEVDGGAVAEIAALLSADAKAPFSREEGVRQAVRDMLRHGGYKPTGRGKPASEYLVRAVDEGALASINVAVDACNAVSLHTGLPISVVDLDVAALPLRIAMGAAGERYVFNRAGHEIDVGGLLCLYDAEGPCGNAVKDAQRTKTRPDTTCTLSVVWGVAGHESLLAGAARWYRELLESAGAVTDDVAVET
jgi:DNA/RNA-binding domain of Phe-tRNA-synthetase-like protein